MLKKILLIPVLLSFLSFPAYAGFQEGKEAYDRKDWVKTIAELRPLAEAGDDRAMVLIGNMYYSGYGVVKSYKEAMSLYSRAATEKNNADAMLALGSMYVSGEGVDKNLHTTLQWFLKAANLGNQPAAFLYATIFFRGNKSVTDDIPSDFYTAYKWFRITAQETQFPQFSEAAKKLADLIAKQKLSAEQIAKADKEVTDWKPAAAK